MQRAKRISRTSMVAAAGVVVLGLGLAVAHLVAERVRRERPDWGAPQKAKNAANPVPPTEANIAAAEVLYADNCTRCHGDTGKGDGPDASMYKPRPSDLTQPRMNAIKDGELFWKITTGNEPMPDYEKRLDEQQRWQLVNLVRALAKAPPGGAPEKAAPNQK